MHRDLSRTVHRKEHAVSQLERLIYESLGIFSLSSFGGEGWREEAHFPAFCQYRSRHDFHVVLTEPIQPKPLVRIVKPAISPDLTITVAGSPLANIGVKTFSVFHHWRQKGQLAPGMQFLLQSPA